MTKPFGKEPVEEHGGELANGVERKTLLITRRPLRFGGGMRGFTIAALWRKKKVKIVLTIGRQEVNSGYRIPERAMGGDRHGSSRGVLRRGAIELREITTPPNSQSAMINRGGQEKAKASNRCN